MLIDNHAYRFWFPTKEFTGLRLILIWTKYDLCDKSGVQNICLDLNLLIINELLKIYIVINIKNDF